MRPNGLRSTILVGAALACTTLGLAWPMSEALAATPGEINFQGLLLDSVGDVVNGSVDLDFELFDAASAGTSLWSESQPSVSVFDGVYDVALGAVSPIGPAVLAGGSVWLEVTVEGETLAPRQRLLAVPYALHAQRADEADTAGNLPLGTLEHIYENFPFDGQAPPNDDPREGLADTDNDGILNFVDADNDGDGLDDGVEIGQGTDINLATPTISNAAPSIASDIFSTPVVVTGTNFVAGQTVAVGPQTPTPTNITATRFDIVLDAQPAPMSTSLIVTRPNGEQASLPFGFELTLPSISSLTPLVLPLNDPVALDIVGANFLGPLTVTLDGNPVVPTSVTDTSFSISVAAPAPGVMVPLSVSLSNGQNDLESFTFTLVTPEITGVFPMTISASDAETLSVTGTNFLVTLDVTFDGSPVTPYSVTTTSFSVDIVAPGVEGLVPFVVTLSNGQSDSQDLLIVEEKSVFVTSTTATGGSIGGLAGADAMCASRASAAGLGGTFLAWLADSTGSPATRFSQSGEPYNLVDNTIIANTYADLIDGTLQNSISLNELGNPVTTGSYVWTNVSYDGTAAGGADCTDWTSTVGSGVAGVHAETSGSWTDGVVVGCGSAHPVYCFEQ